MSVSKYHVLIVCTGNTCRSPMAEGTLKSIFTEKGVNDIEVSSAGIGAMSGFPATPFAIEAARHWGVDISRHRARMLDRSMIGSADLILAMAPEHVETILHKEPSAASRTFLIKSFPERYSLSQEGVDDPIGGTLEDYNQTYLELDEVLRRIEGKIIELSKTLKKDS